jgi:hypothetical protein
VQADVVASVMVLQALEGLSDRDAAGALRDRIGWKVSCGLALDDEGFDYSVLACWRARPTKSEQRKGSSRPCEPSSTPPGCLGGKACRAPGSTLIDDAVPFRTPLPNWSPPCARPACCAGSGRSASRCS